VFLTFAILMIWVRRRKEALEVEIVDRTAKLTAANEDLHRQKEQLDGLFELSPDAVILTDEGFHVLRVNQEFTRIFGYTAEEVAGQWLPDLIVPEKLRVESLKYRALLTLGKRVELEAIRQRKDGVRFDVSVVARGISLGFDQVAFYIIYRDITERKKAEDNSDGVRATWQMLGDSVTPVVSAGVFRAENSSGQRKPFKSSNTSKRRNRPWSFLSNGFIRKTRAW
jgi:PAS domain S-box-containing protein